MSRRPVALALLVLLAVAAAVLFAEAQFRSGGFTPPAMGQFPERTGFTFCRLVYSSSTREAGGQGWSTDYPGADQNLMIRLPEFTLTRVTRFPDGSPQHAFLQPTDSNLFQCPFLFASDVGTATFSAQEAEQLRVYLEKGGFLWVDDFWGTAAWLHWMREIGRVLPEYAVEELTMEHPIFSTFYTMDEIPQIPSIMFWRRNNGATSERGSDSAIPRVYGISDSAGRLLVLMSHNTDIADGWEREGEDYEFFHSFSPLGYAVGVNVAIWSLTH